MPRARNLHHAPVGCFGDCSYDTLCCVPSSHNIIQSLKFVPRTAEESQLGTRGKATRRQEFTGENVIIITQYMWLNSWGLGWGGKIIKKFKMGSVLSVFQGVVLVSSRSCQLLLRIQLSNYSEVCTSESVGIFSLRSWTSLSLNGLFLANKIPPASFFLHPKLL